MIYDVKKLLKIVGQEQQITIKNNTVLDLIQVCEENNSENEINKTKSKKKDVLTFNQQELIQLQQRLCGIDLNLNQIALSFTQTQEDIKNNKAISTLFNIKPLKSINQYYS